MSLLIPFQVSRIVVGIAPTLLVQIPRNGMDRLISFEVASAAGSSPLNTFSILRQLHDQGSWLPYFSGTDFSTTTLRLIASPTGPQQLPAGKSAWVDVDCGAAVAIQLWASVATGTAIVSIYGGGRIT